MISDDLVEPLATETASQAAYLLEPHKLEKYKAQQLVPVMPITALSAAALLAACGGGGGGSSTDATPVAAAPPAAPGTPGTPVTPTTPVAPVTPATPVTPAGLYAFTTPGTAEDAARFLLQAQFNASDAEIASVQSTGYAAYLNAQISAPGSQTGFDWLNSRGYGVVDSTNRYYDSTYPGDYMMWTQLMTSPDAARKRMALALSEFFVVSLNGLDF